MKKKDKIKLLRRELKEAIELLWEAQVKAENGDSAYAPGSYWIEMIEKNSGLKNIDRHGWREEEV